jgi:FPC/CPF motif-containing protein YcgG
MSLPANFYVPRSAELPAFRCRLCEAVIRGREAFGRHMKNCSDNREEQMRENVSAHKNPHLWGDAHDPEVREYVRRTGRWYGIDPKA